MRSSSFQSFPRLPSSTCSLVIPLQRTLICMEHYSVFPNLGIHFKPTLPLIGKIWKKISLLLPLILTLQTCLSIACRSSKISNHKPFLEAQFKKTRFINATLGSRTINRCKGLSKNWKTENLAFWEISSTGTYHPLFYHGTTVNNRFRSIIVLAQIKII